MDGFAEARAITKEQAKTFYFGSLFLSREERYATYAAYAICKISDEAVDNAGSRPRPEDLEKIAQMVEAAYGNGPLGSPLLSAFRQTIRKYSIPKDYFGEVLAGMRMDIVKNRYADFSELYLYCCRVAGAVGLIVLKILGQENKAAEEYAMKLGVALQLTNITRDIKEDYLRGRIYLPQDEMKKFNVSEEDIRCSRLNDNVISLLKYQIERARSFYSSSLKGLPFLRGIRSRFVILAIKEVYAGILDEIEKSSYDVFSRRPYVNKFKKCIIALSLLGKKELYYENKPG